MKMNYLFADIVFEISTIYPYFHDFAKQYLCEKKAQFKIEITNDDIANWSKENNVDTNIYPNEYIETLVVHSKLADILINKNIFIFHGSTIYVDNLANAYIFTAKSGTGKSTHVRLLKESFPNSIQYINDDKPFISLEGDSFYVYGSPFDGKDRISNNVKGKLKGIFLLNRDENNSVIKIKGSSAINTLLEQIHYEETPKSREKAFNFIFKLSNVIPCYKLKVNMNKDAALTSYKIMSEGK